MEPCARNMRTTGAVRVRPTDHQSRVRATCGPQKPCNAKRGPGTSASEDQGRVRPQSHKISTSLVLLQVLIRVRVTELVAL